MDTAPNLGGAVSICIKYYVTKESFFDVGQASRQKAQRFWSAAIYLEQQDNSRATHIARWSVARVLRELGQVETALDIQRALKADGVEDGFVYEEIGECLYALGKTQDAKPYGAAERIKRIRETIR